jgi:hypothetical protein
MYPQAPTTLKDLDFVKDVQPAAAHLSHLDYLPFLPLPVCPNIEMYHVRE